MPRGSRWSQRVRRFSASARPPEQTVVSLGLAGCPPSPRPHPWICSLPLHTYLARRPLRESPWHLSVYELSNRYRSSARVLLMEFLLTAHGGGPALINPLFLQICLSECQSGVWCHTYSRSSYRRRRRYGGRTDPRTALFVLRNQRSGLSVAILDGLSRARPAEKLHVLQTFGA